MNKGVLQHKYIILVLLAILGLAFYWYEWRPTQIKKDCYNIAREKAIEKGAREDKKFYKDDYDTYYKWCLEQKGL